MDVISASSAAALVKSGATLLIGGSGHGHAVPETLLQAIGAAYGETGAPGGLTLIHPVGLGDGTARGVDHLARPGMIRRVVTSTMVDCPNVGRMVADGECEGYVFPFGVLSQLNRAVAANQPGIFSAIGLETFVDPRQRGGRLNARTTEPLNEVVTVRGREWLHYYPFKADIALLCGTTADQDGNISMEDEAIYSDNLTMAQAVHNNGGTVIVQVKRLTRRNGLNAKAIKIPGIFVDHVVVEPDQQQTFFTGFNPAYSGHVRTPGNNLPRLSPGVRKLIARRCIAELRPGQVVNLGTGIANGIAPVAAEYGLLDQITLTNEQGIVGGLPVGGDDVGAGMNHEALVDTAAQFDFYDGGGLDIAFLSFAEVDRFGNVNVSRFNNRIIGCGGFINISQPTRNVIFCGTFTAGGLDVTWDGAALKVRTEGRFRKFTADVEEISFNGARASRLGHSVRYVTERAVFDLRPEGLTLVQIAPGIDLERDILAHMAFRPVIAPDLETMSAALFETLGATAGMAP